MSAECVGTDPPACRGLRGGPVPGDPGARRPSDRRRRPGDPRTSIRRQLPGLRIHSPYPTWPIQPSAFDDAPQFTPRLLLQRADAHKNLCLRTDTVVELAHLSDDIADAAQRQRPVETPAGAAPAGDVDELDRRFADYRRKAVASAALDPEGEDTTMPGLLAAGLEAWITERADVEQSFRTDPPPGSRVVLHARLRQSLDDATDDERHWAFRAIAHSNAVAVQNRLRKAWDATGIGSDPDKRRLVLLRNTRWPSGKKTAAMLEELEAAGGRTLPITDDDLRTLTALRDMIDDNHPDLPGWLQRRRPAHGLALLREVLGELSGGTATPAPEPVQPATVAEPAAPAYADVADAADEVPLGTDAADETLSVRLAALRKHTAIFAGSGSGKTVLIRRLIEECALRRLLDRPGLTMTCPASVIRGPHLHRAGALGRRPPPSTSAAPRWWCGHRGGTRDGPWRSNRCPTSPVSSTVTTNSRRRWTPRSARWSRGR